MKGNFANCVRVFPASAIQFSSYGVLKSFLYSGDHTITSGDRLVAGALAGAIAQTITYPLDLVRALLTVNMTTKDSRSLGIIGTMSEVVQTSGFKGLFRGLATSLAGIMPYVGIDFCVYDTLRPLLPKKQNSDEPLVVWKLLAGALAGACGQTIAYPLDTVRRILQVQHVKVKRDGVKYAGMVDCFLGVVKRDGFLALYHGLFANYLKVIPSVAISFTVFEYIQKQLKGSFKH
jgi:solute carrier family 25 phosphate transporter 23/24/25/41